MSVFFLSALLIGAASGSTVVVTGGLGFIGSHVTEELLKDGHKVVIFDDESNGHNHNPQATFVWNDISTKEDFDKYDGPVDYVIHLAAASEPPAVLPLLMCVSSIRSREHDRPR